MSLTPELAQAIHTRIRYYRDLGIHDFYRRAEPEAPAVTEPAEPTPVSLQTIANAYGDYSKKSFEQTSAFVAKLAGARTLANALELQTAFAREAYETFVAESCRIRKLHSELAKQRFGSLGGFVSGMTRTTRNT